MDVGMRLTLSNYRGTYQRLSLHYDYLYTFLAKSIRQYTQTDAFIISIKIGITNSKLIILLHD